jgi:hypothetical protein
VEEAATRCERGSNAAVAVVAWLQWQRGDGHGTSLVALQHQRWQQHGGSHAAVGAATVAMKTPAATAMAGAQTTINNQLKAAAATTTDMAKTTKIKT